MGRRLPGSPACLRIEKIGFKKDSNTADDNSSHSIKKHDMIGKHKDYVFLQIAKLFYAQKAGNPNKFVESFH
jgi:hypothetical protein